jgi:hypothetical protein
MRHRRIVVAAVLAALALGAAAVPAPAPRPVEAPVYVAGSQYSAVLDQETRHWRLMPLDGQDLIVANPDVYCRADAAIPAGLWLVATDPAGGVELRATSLVALPAGYPAQVALRACGDAGNAGDVAALHAPRAFIELLASNTGAVYVHD